jgi:hypothetical protein
LNHGLSKQNTAKSSPDWYTPPSVFSALGLMFDLDPCQPKGGLPWIPARRFYCFPEHGLHLPWEGRVWLNPPYGPHTKRWIGKFLEHGNGVALVFVRTGSTWGQAALRGAGAVLFMAGRVKFISPGGKDGTSPADSMLIACGAENVAALASSGLGVLMAASSAAARSESDERRPSR